MLLSCRDFDDIDLYPRAVNVKDYCNHLEFGCVWKGGSGDNQPYSNTAQFNIVVEQLDTDRDHGNP